MASSSATRRRFDTKFALPSTRDRITLTESRLKAGKFELAGGGLLSRGSDHSEATLTLNGELPCSALAETSRRVAPGQAARRQAGREGRKIRRKAREWQRPRRTQAERRYAKAERRKDRAHDRRGLRLAPADRGRAQQALGHGRQRTVEELADAAQRPLEPYPGLSGLPSSLPPLPSGVPPLPTALPTALPTLPNLGLPTSLPTLPPPPPKQPPRAASSQQA